MTTEVESAQPAEEPPPATRETHEICTACWLERNGRGVLAHPEPGTCCWCGDKALVVPLSTTSQPIMCPGHDDPDALTLADFARAVLTAYHCPHPYAMDNAINALEEAL